MDNPITRTQISPNQHTGGRDVDWIAIHTQEGPGTAASLTNYLCNPNSEVSYNAVVDDAESVLVVQWANNPWSASNANARADHICLAGSYANWSRGKWLDRNDSDGLNEDAMLTRAAAVVAYRCVTRGIPIEYVGGGSQPPNRPGVCGHRDFGQWGGGHTDPGPNFPWDELITRARAIAGGQTVGDDMALLDEQFTNWQGEQRSVRDYLHFTDKYIGLTLDQLNGPDSRAQGGDPTRWDMLGGNTAVEALALIGEALKIPGFKAPAK